MIALNRMAFGPALPRNNQNRASPSRHAQAANVEWIVSFADGAQCAAGRSIAPQDSSSHRVGGTTRYGPRRRETFSRTSLTAARAETFSTAHIPTRSCTRSSGRVRRFRGYVTEPFSRSGRVFIRVREPDGAGPATVVLPRYRRRRAHVAVVGRSSERTATSEGRGQRTVRRSRRRAEVPMPSGKPFCRRRTSGRRSRRCRRWGSPGRIATVPGSRGARWPATSVKNSTARRSKADAKVSRHAVPHGDERPASGGDDLLGTRSGAAGARPTATCRPSP